MPLHFLTKEGYRKYLAYTHIHGIKTKTKQKVFINGKEHKVKHDFSKRKST